jgi:hypothetical protein
LNVVGCALCTEMNVENLKLAGATMGRWLGRSEED